MFIVSDLISVAFFLLIVAAPIPLSLSIIAYLSSSDYSDKSPTLIMLLISFWCVINTTLALVLGVLNLLNSHAVFISESALFVIGLLMYARRHLKTPIPSGDVEKGEPVGMVSSRKFYGLYVKRLDVNVKFLPPESDSVEECVNKLRSQGVRLIGFGPIGGVTKAGMEFEWLQDPHGYFERVLGQNPTHQMLLYKLKDESITDK